MKNGKNSKKSIKIFAIIGVVMLLCTGAVGMLLLSEECNRQTLDKPKDSNKDPVEYDEDPERIWIKHEIDVYNDSTYYHKNISGWVDVDYDECIELDRNFKLYVDGEFHSNSYPKLGLTLEIGINPTTNEIVETPLHPTGVFGYRFGPLDTTKYENGRHELEIKDESNSTVANIIVFVQN